jgi:hypothetical protein
MKLDSFYDYSKVVYVNFDTPITIICPIHGEFMHTPHDHISGRGCRYCSGNTIFNKKTQEEIKEYWLKNKITSGHAWSKHWKDNNLKESGYPSNPWTSYRMNMLQWREYVGNKKKTQEETKDFWIKRSIVHSEMWRKLWKENNLKKLGYPCSPWESYGITPTSQWIEYVWGKKPTKTQEETKDFWIKRGITSSKMWQKIWKENNLKDLGYLCQPWVSYEISKAKWVDYVWDKKK